MVSTTDDTRTTNINIGLLRLMKQKIYNKNNVVHYYEWIHCYCSSIFFRSILENRMLFWIDIIRFRSPQVLQVLLHYKYHWHLVQVYVIINLFMFTIAIRIDTFLHSFSMLLHFYNRIWSHTRPIKSYKETSSRRISTILSVRDSLVYSILLFIIKILLEYTSTTLLAERYK